MTSLHSTILQSVYGAPANLPGRAPTRLVETPFVVVVFLYHQIPHGHLFGCCQILIGMLVVFLFIGFCVIFVLGGRSVEIKDR